MLEIWLVTSQWLIAHYGDVVVVKEGKDLIGELFLSGFWTLSRSYLILWVEVLAILDRFSGGRTWRPTIKMEKKKIRKKKATKR